MYWPLVCILAAAVVVLVLMVLGRVSLRRERNTKRSGRYADTFIAIEDNGSARELTSDEVDYLNAEFHPADGARPYIKSSYGTTSPDGRMGGFLRRGNLPLDVQVRTESASHGK